MKYILYFRYPDSVKRELVMTKEVFIECYNKWIKENKDVQDNIHN